MMIKVLDGVSCLAFDNFKEAALRLSSISMIDDQSITQIITPTDLAYYITIVSLFSMNRKDMKSLIL